MFLLNNLWNLMNNRKIKLKIKFFFMNNLKLIIIFYKFNIYYNQNKISIILFIIFKFLNLKIYYYLK